MKKRLGFILLGLSAICLATEKLEVNSEFKAPQSTGLPAQWNINAWSGYKPLAKFQVITENQKNILQVTEVKGTYGFGITSSRRLNLQAGDIVLISGMGKGQGKLQFGMQFFDKKGTWLGVKTMLTQCYLQKQWQKINLSMAVENIPKKGATNYVCLAISGSKNAQVQLRDLQFEVIKNVPPEWGLNLWQGYRPLPTFQNVVEDQKKVLKITDIQGKYGFGLNAKKLLKALPGDCISVAAWVKGSGTIWCSLQNFDSKGRWLGIQSGTIRRKLSEQWQYIQVDIPVQNLAGKSATGQVMLTWGAAKNSWISIRDIDFKIKKLVD